MECPKCNIEFTGYQDYCHNCGYLFDSFYEKLYDEHIREVIYSIIIDETIDAYFNNTITHYKRETDSKIIFKNISTKFHSQKSDELSYEDWVINFYKQNGYNAFFAENNYWIILYSMIYDYENFINSPFAYELISTNIHFARKKNTKISFNSIKHIPNIINQIINAYFKNICSRVSPIEFYKNNNNCGLRNYFKLNQFIITPSYLTNDQLLLIFERMLDDLKYYSYGFPDLIVYNDDEFFFVEVKSKEDIPSFKQIQWHKFLSEVVGIDVVLFMLDKSDEQVFKIKKSYDVELENSKKRKQLLIENNKKISIDWGSNELKHKFIINKKDFNDLILKNNYSCRHRKYVVNDYTSLTYEYFPDDEWEYYTKLRLATSNDLIFEKAKELYPFNESFKDYSPSKKQLEINKKAKSFEDNGKYFEAVNLYMQNVIERTSSPITYKRLIYIFNKFDKFDDVINLMDIAIPIFISLNDKTNSLRFIYQRFAAMHENKWVDSMRIISSETLKPLKRKTKDKQTDLSSFFK